MIWTPAWSAGPAKPTAPLEPLKSMLASVVLMQSSEGCYTERLPVAVAVARTSQAAVVKVSGKWE